MSSPIRKLGKYEGAFLPFSAPTFGQDEKEELLAALRSDWITTGPRTLEFERRFANYVGVTEAVAVNSCTAALHLALAALEIGQQDAVITTPFTFAATANVIVHQGAFPVFVDIDPDTYNLDPGQLNDLLTKQCVWDRSDHSLHLKSNGRRLKAIIPVHYGGQPCDMESIGRLADEFEMAVIEDAAHAVGAKYRNRNVGTLGKVACFSFYANKNMTTAEGGMLTTNDPELASRVRILSLHGMSKDAWNRYSERGTWQYDIVNAGFKYNLTDLASALGLHQLAKLDSFISRRSDLARLYSDALAGVPEIKLPTVSPGMVSAWHLYPIQVHSPNATRNDIISALRERHIGSSVHFIPLHMTSYYQQTFGYKNGDCPVAERTFEHIISLPLFPRMEDADVMRVVGELCSIVRPTSMAMAS